MGWRGWAGGHGLGRLLLPWGPGRRAWPPPSHHTTHAHTPSIALAPPPPPLAQNSKDYFDQSLDEIRVLRYVNSADPDDEYGLLRLYDYFYWRVRQAARGWDGGCARGWVGGAPATSTSAHVPPTRLLHPPRPPTARPPHPCLQEHLVLVCELLRANLYEFHRYNRESGGDPYFTLPRIQSVARQVRAHACACACACACVGHLRLGRARPRRPPPRAQTLHPSLARSLARAAWATLSAPPHTHHTHTHHTHTQVLTSLAFLHSLGLLHADLKPENILMASYSGCRVKVVDLGSSCYATDRLSTYVQARVSVGGGGGGGLGSSRYATGRLSTCVCVWASVRACSSLKP